MKSVITVSKKESLDSFYQPWNSNENENVLYDIARHVCPNHYNLSWKDLCELRDSIDLSTSTYSPGLIAVLQLHALRSKNVSFRYDSVDPLQTALLKFRESEHTCLETNTSLRTLGSPHGERDVIFHYAAKKAADILGRVPSLSSLRLQFGPGASSNVKNYTSPRFKLGSCPSVSKDLVQSSYLLGYLKNVPHWLSLHKEVKVMAGRLAFVPKNWKTHRPIVIEPSLNGIYQKALGGYIKDRLIKFGVDLFDQNINKQRARIGSLDNSVATLDLSSASDTISYNLVMELLPVDWFEILSSLRTGEVAYKDELIQLNKFSSMGNGYTFELESLIFYCLAYGISQVRDRTFDLTVYGDDLICNPLLARDISELFPSFGFSFSEKSYFDGNFRESCGGDYLLGNDIRPFFVKDTLSYATCVSMYNFLVRKPHFDLHGRVRTLLKKCVPTRYRLYGPDGYGDGHFIVQTPPLEPFKRSDGWGGHTFSTFTAVPKRSKCKLVSDSIIHTYYAENPTKGSVFTLRNKNPRSKKTTIYTLDPN